VFFPFRNTHALNVERTDHGNASELDTYRRFSAALSRSDGRPEARKAPLGKLAAASAATIRPRSLDAPTGRSEGDEPAGRGGLGPFAPVKRRRQEARLDWFAVFWITALHVGALAAPFVFTWWAIPLALVLGWMTGGIGICLGYHRLFTHHGFVTYRPLRWLIAWLGNLAGQGTLIDWVAKHREHHAHSDHEGDPHSPHDGPWWAHMFWPFWKESREVSKKRNLLRTADLAKDPVLRWIDRMFLVSHLVTGAALFGFGYWLGGVPGGCAAVIWGMFVRLVYVLHATWFVNSASHMWGYRNYPTKDNSRNLWWVALLTYGEGWHNNHHAFPRMARHGHKWWELDVTFRTIRLLERLGLAWDVVAGQHKKPAPCQATATASP
jgi:fatty-acid desaturase